MGPDLLLNALLPPVVGALRRLPFGARLITEAVVGVLANATPPRPRPLSLACDYPSWPSLTDRTFTGRHLPPAAPGAVRLPPVTDVVELFLRRPGQEVLSSDTSVLFLFFAQWFTDSFLRTDRADSRRNTSTQEIDFCQLYGLSEDRTRLLRARRGGLLSSQSIDGEEYPPYLFERSTTGVLSVRPEFSGLHDEHFLLDVLLKDVSETQKDLFFAVGLEHGNSTIGSTALDVLFLREHNRIAAELEREHARGALRPAWGTPDPDELDERLFQTTRLIMTVLLLKLVVEEYIRHITPFDLPLVLIPGQADGKPWNHANQIAVEFNLLYRWHSLVPEQMETDQGAVPAREFMRDNNALLLERGVGWLLTQASLSRAGRVGLGNTPAWLVERQRPDWPSVEERTIALMRGARLAGYNDYRERFGLPRLTSFVQLTGDPALQQRLTELYGDIDHLEWYVGVFAEDYPPAQFLGALLTTMVGHDAFTQALTNPLMSERVHTPETFTETGLRIIRETTSLQQIAARNVRPTADLLADFTWRPVAARPRAAEAATSSPVPGQRQGSATGRSGRAPAG